MRVGVLSFVTPWDIVTLGEKELGVDKTSIEDRV